MKFRTMLFSAVVAVVGLSATLGFGQYYNNNNDSVGGVSIDANGLVTNAKTSDTEQFIQMRQKSMQPVAAELQKESATRKISLKAIDAIIADCKANNKPIPDSVAFMGGLTKIEFVFAYPEKNDIVLVGPGEAWKIGANGAPVGVKTGAPIMLLEDFATAIQTCAKAQRGTFSCSIDPTPEGMKNLRVYTSRLVPNMNPQTAARNIEKAMGNQSVRVMGVDPASHFARVMVSSDYQMKQISMGTRAASVKGLPPFTKMVAGGASGASNSLPRWWLAPNYGAVLRDEAGLSWQLQGGSVKTMCETDFYAENGQIQRGTVKVAPGYQKWADTMTARYEELSKAEPVFGQLRNCMDSAVVAALIVKENLLSKVENKFNAITELDSFEFAAPKEVPAMAAVNKARKVTIVCGGVDINPWQIVSNTEVKAELNQAAKDVQISEGSFFAN